jgi:hypothetical protein
MLIFLLSDCVLLPAAPTGAVLLWFDVEELDDAADEDNSGDIKTHLMSSSSSSLDVSIE